MSRPSRKRAELMAAMERETHAVSTLNLLVSQALAAHLGINSSDFECLDLARKAPGGAITAGDLAAATGLTSGAITGVIDRLERAGLVRRDRDGTDRRKVIVRPTPDAERTVPPLVEPIHRAMTEMWSSYSDAELALLLDFLVRCVEVLRARETSLRQGRRRPAALTMRGERTRRRSGLTPSRRERQ